MHPVLRAIAERHAGVFTRRQALDCGYTERQLKTLTGHRGEWLTVRRGVYVERWRYESAGHDGRYLMLVHAAAITAHKNAVTSHTGAAVVHSMPTRPRWRQLAHLTRPDVLGGRTENGVKHHRAALPGDQLVTVSGLVVTNLARTAVDVAREHGFEDGVVACDAAKRLGVSHEELVLVVEAGRHWPHNARARQSVDFSDGGAHNLAESLLRTIIKELHIGTPHTQHEITHEGRTVWVDIRVGRHLFEFDGRIKYLERDAGGVADKSPSEVVWDEKVREDLIRRADGGYGVSRVVWDEMFGANRERLKRRLYAEFCETVRRFGR